MPRRFGVLLFLTVLNSCASRDAPSNTDSGQSGDDTAQQTETSTPGDTLVRDVTSPDTALPDTQLLDSAVD
jgi:hypothetical protein